MSEAKKRNPDVRTCASDPHALSRHFFYFRASRRHCDADNLSLPGSACADVLSWGVPGWVGNGSYFSDANIAYQTSFVRGAKEVYNISVDYLGIWY